jgi:DNA polymerase-3 subunit gamma/tau
MDALSEAEPASAQKKTESPALTAAVPVDHIKSDIAIDWPQLVIQLKLRGVAQQLATQSELLAIEQNDAVVELHLRVPVETLLSAGSADKLAAAVGKHLGKKVNLHTRIGAVNHTAHAASVAEQAARQQAAELAMENDPFVQTLKREFGATIVPGSVRPL